MDQPIDDDTIDGVKSLMKEAMDINKSWINFCQKQSMSTFSHFTHVASQELFMITDLQGTGCLLSDPAIHSENTELF